MTAANHGSFTTQDSQKTLLDLFKAKIGTPTFLMLCHSQIKFLLHGLASPCSSAKNRNAIKMNPVMCRDPTTFDPDVCV